MPRKKSILNFQKTPTPEETNQAAAEFLKKGVNEKAVPQSFSLTPPQSANQQKAVSEEIEGRGLIKTRRRGIQRRMTIYFPADLAKQLQVHCAEQDKQISETVADAVFSYLNS